MLSRLRIAFYKIIGLRIKGHVFLGSISIPNYHKSITLHAGVALDDRVTLLSVSGESGSSGKIAIGRGTYINRNTMLDASESIEIGENCAFGPNCYITDHDHGFDFKTSPLQLPLVNSPTIIGNNVWVGANSIILKGVTIGDFAVIGAGSIVTKSIPPKTIVTGKAANPRNYA